VANVRDSDGTLVFTGEAPGPGTALTIAACRRAGVPHRVVPWTRAGDVLTPASTADWLARHRIRTLNVAGDRESAAPGIGARVEAYLADLFRLQSDGDERPVRGSGDGGPRPRPLLGRVTAGGLLGDDETQPLGPQRRQ